MAKPVKIKTTENEASVADFVNTVTDEQKRSEILPELVQAGLNLIHNYGC